MITERALGKHARARHERGSVLVFSYLAIAMLIIFGSTMMIQGAVENRSATVKRDLSQAFSWAEAGLDDATHRLNDPISGYWNNCESLSTSHADSTRLTTSPSRRTRLIARRVGSS